MEEDGRSLSLSLVVELWFQRVVRSRDERWNVSAVLGMLLWWWWWPHSLIFSGSISHFTFDREREKKRSDLLANSFDFQEELQAFLSADVSSFSLFGVGRGCVNR